VQHLLYTGAVWALEYDAANDRFLIDAVGGTHYLAYSFAGPYWMDGANGYPLAQITGGSSPYWFEVSRAGSLNLLSQAGLPMVVVPGVTEWWVSYFIQGPTPATCETWVYEAVTTAWYYYSSMFQGVPYSWGYGSPSPYRP
jgi:hypothetical protein